MKLLIATAIISFCSLGYAQEESYELDSKSMVVLNRVLEAVEASEKVKFFGEEVGFDNIKYKSEDFGKHITLEIRSQYIFDGDIRCGWVSLTIKGRYSILPNGHNGHVYKSTVNKNELFKNSYCQLKEIDELED